MMCVRVREGGGWAWELLHITKYNGSVTFIFDLNKRPKNPGELPTYMRNLPMLTLAAGGKPRKFGELQYSNRNHMRISGHKINPCCGGIDDSHRDSCTFIPANMTPWHVPDAALAVVARAPSPTYSASPPHPAGSSSSVPTGDGNGGNGNGKERMPPPPAPADRG